MPSNADHKIQFYKVARPDGFDFRTGNTINYRKNIGKIVSNPEKTESKKLCTADVIHASEFFFDALYYGEIPCSIFLVEGIPVSKQSDKAGFKELKIIKEIPTANWQNAFHSLMIWMLEDLKNNFDCKKEKDATDAVNQAIQVFVNAQKTGMIDMLAAKSAESAARSAEYALYALSAGPAGFAVRSAWYVVRSVAWSTISAEAVARSAAEAAARSALSATRSATEAVARSAAEAAARSALSATRSAAEVVARSAWYVAEVVARSAWYVVRSVAWSTISAEAAARSALPTTRSAAEAAARSAWYVAISVNYAARSAESAARSAEYAALSARSTTLSVEYTARSAEAAKKKEISDKFIGLLVDYEK